ncbi:MAG: hypothetical protein H5T74_08795 [Actinobacteria bacterium]|nr:hypothetical protein [Actinomycetota bacterium]
MGGEIIAEKFALLRTRGGNGVAVTHLVEDTLLGERAVVKVSEGLEDLAFEYLKTYNLARELDLPGLLMPLEGGLLEEEGGYYMAFPELGEPSLEDWLRTGGLLRCEEIMALALGILRALEGLHGAGLVHLFLNPRNVFYRPGGHVTLKDPALRSCFFSRFLEEVAAPDFHYFSPAVMDGDPPGPEADLFAVGRLVGRLLEEAGDAGSSPCVSRIAGLAQACMEAGIAGSAVSARDLLAEFAGESAGRGWDVAGSGGGAPEPGEAKRREETVTGGHFSPRAEAAPSECMPEPAGNAARRGHGATRGIGRPFAALRFTRPLLRMSGRRGLSGTCAGEGESPAAGEARVRTRAEASGQARGRGAPSGSRPPLSLERKGWATALLLAAFLFLALAGWSGAFLLLQGGGVKAPADSTAGRSCAGGDAAAAAGLLGRSRGLTVDGTASGLRTAQGEVEANGGAELEGAAAGSTRDATVDEVEGARDGGEEPAAAPSSPAGGSGAPPVASFTLTPAEGRSPLQVLLDASASHDPDGRIVAYSWSFGAAGVRLYHVFESSVIPARISVTLTVTDDVGNSASATRYVTLY